MKSILNSIKKRCNEFTETIAQAIEEGDWKLVARSAGLICLAVGLLLTALLVVLALLWRVLGTFLGKIFMSLVGGPFILYLLFLSYKVNREDALKSHQKQSDSADLEAWAESVYGHLRDAVFFVFRSMSEYTAIVKPTSPSSVELPNGISIRDGYAVFTFYARVLEDVDVAQLKRDMARVLSQKVKAHELEGIPADLVQINGAYYCPLQIFDCVDYGDSINVSIVFANEKTVELVRARKMLRLENPKLHRQAKREAPYDDQL